MLTLILAEMLFQSHLGELHLLPALPDAWPDGEVNGLKARGNYEVNIKWSQGKLDSAKISVSNSGNITLRTQLPVEVAVRNFESKEDGDYFLTTFSVQAGDTYRN